MSHGVSPPAFDEAVALGGGAQVSASRPDVKFYHRYTYNEDQSFVDGVPRYDTEIWVKISFKDQSTKKLDKKAKREDTIKYKAEWDRFIQENSVAEEGTPIETMVWLGGERIRALKHAGYITVERLSGMSPEKARAWGKGMMRAVTQARRILEGGGAELRELRAENVELAARISQLEAKLFQAGTPVQVPTPKGIILP